MLYWDFISLFFPNDLFLFHVSIQGTIKFIPHASLGFSGLWQFLSLI